ncbi:hypothetical protein KIN20_016684 [Parelaphostrongylus tenuis]|uniref:Uncharacterized protein n=1 Tax=Parelaphostrongylus tenuis TaxID=148309 RepID=A0AAD5QPZ6_PARTN|nr:hypothetical protein KIN20_016684 [Parelaphostrongylus tenuis]
MERVDGTTLTIEEFQEKYERPRNPCIITGLTKNWKAHENWTIGGKHTKDMLNDYEVPLIFHDDLFKILGKHEKRPHYR